MRAVYATALTAFVAVTLSGCGSDDTTTPKPVGTTTPTPATNATTTKPEGPTTTKPEGPTTTKPEGPTTPTTTAPLGPNTTNTSTPAPVSGHYEKPPCQDGEKMMLLTDHSRTVTDGATCAPRCAGSDSDCPTDVLDGVTAQPSCTYEDGIGNLYCALNCDSDDECDVAGGGWCAFPNPGETGTCVYPAPDTTTVHTIRRTGDGAITV